MAEIATILAYAAALLAVAAMAATTIRQLRYAMFVAGLAALAHFALTDQLGWAIIAAVFLVINGMQISVLRRRARRGGPWVVRGSRRGRGPSASVRGLGSVRRLVPGKREGRVPMARR